MSDSILLIEDNRDEAELFALAASEAGIGLRIDVARSGEEALDALLRRGLTPAAMLLDLKMPGIGGLETLRRIRGEPALRGLTVFVLTSSDLVEDRTAAQELGCDAYFVKPMTFSGYIEMAGRIRTMLPPERAGKDV